MKQTIRNGAFETNSSSMHSICVVKKQPVLNAEDHEIYLSNSGSWYLSDYRLYYGRSPFKVLYDFENKWKYCLCSLCEEYKDDVWNELKRIAFEHIKGLTSIIVDKEVRSCPIKKEGVEYEKGSYIYEYGKTEDELLEYLEKLELKYDIEIDYFTNKDETEWKWEVPYTGYAEDYGMLKKYLNKKQISLEEFICNPKYIVIIDGDEYCVFDGLVEAGLINKDNIEEQIYEVDVRDETGN